VTINAASSIPAVLSYRKLRFRLSGKRRPLFLPVRPGRWALLLQLTISVRRVSYPITLRVRRS
jgi:hypothetical protein